MDANETTKVIESVGGDLAFANLLGIKKTRFFQQKINNWKRRGMPHKVILEHYDQLKRLRAKVARK